MGGLWGGGDPRFGYPFLWSRPSGQSKPGLPVRGGSSPPHVCTQSRSLSDVIEQVTLRVRDSNLLFIYIVSGVIYRCLTRGLPLSLIVSVFFSIKIIVNASIVQFFFRTKKR